MIGILFLKEGCLKQKDEKAHIHQKKNKLYYEYQNNVFWVFTISINIPLSSLLLHSQFFLYFNLGLAKTCLTYFYESILSYYTLYWEDLIDLMVLI